MSDVITGALEALNQRLGADGFDGRAKFVIEGEGAILLSESGAAADDGEADVTLTSDADTFRAILDGEMDATAAFMSGKLSVDGDMGLAMKLGAALG